jgi:hypothetical protein
MNTFYSFNLDRYLRLILCERHAIRMSPKICHQQYGLQTRIHSIDACRIPNCVSPTPGILQARDLHHLDAHRSTTERFSGDPFHHHATFEAGVSLPAARHLLLRPS